VAKLKTKMAAEAKEPAKKASYMSPKCGEPLKERKFQKNLID
jgi:hypothetical protein